MGSQVCRIDPRVNIVRAVRNPRDFTKPLAMGAPEPVLEIRIVPSRMIHFFDPGNEKMAGKLPDLAARCDVLLGNLEDAVPVDRKIPAREGLVRVGREIDLGDCALWTRVNSLESPWVLDDLTTLVTEIGDRLEVIMVPKVEGPWDIHYVDRLLAQLEARAGLERPILIHAILETSVGVINLEEIANSSPRIQGMSFGPADLAASRRMKTTRVGGGHPGYRVIEDPDPENPESPRATAQQDLWHYSIGRMVDACTSVGILPFYGPFGDIKDVEGCEAQFRAAFLMGCVGAWSLHPVQIDVAKKVFSPDPEEVAFARKVIEAIPDGRGVHMIDGKMQDDATWKQCQVMVRLAGVLVGAKAEIAREYYAGVIYDGLRKLPTFVFSDMGGLDIEEVAEKHPDHIGRGHFSTILPHMDFRAKDVVASIGITGTELNRLTPILSRLARLFVKYDMTLAEINPLAQLEDGSFAAVDAHMDMENEARPRQRELLEQLGISDEETREAREPTPFAIA